MNEHKWLLLIVTCLIAAVAIGAVCGDDDDDDDDDGGKCEDELRIFYYTCDAAVSGMSNSEADEYCGDGNEFWDCFHECFDFADKNCNTFVSCAGGCTGDPWDTGSTDDDTLADDDSWWGDDDDDDDAGTGTCHCHCTCYGCNADISCSPANQCDSCTTQCTETCNENCGGYISSSGDC